MTGLSLGLLAWCPAHADLVEAVVRVKPSVVIVGTFRSTDSPRFRLRGTGFVTGNGNSVITKWGRIGTDGQSKTRDFADAAKAKAEYDKLIKEKSAKGYKESP